METRGEIEGPRHAGARAAVLAIIEEVLTDDQVELLDSALGQIGTEVLHRVVHDGFSESEALDWAHTAAELAAIREMLPVGTRGT